MFSPLKLCMRRMKTELMGTGKGRRREQGRGGKGNGSEENESEREEGEEGGTEERVKKDDSHSNLKIVCMHYQHHYDMGMEQ